MATSPFLAEIRIFAGNFAPRGWAFCDGQILAISQNAALFSLLGTFYGGNGQTTFALPNLQGSTAIGTGQGSGLQDYVVGEIGGTPTVTLTTQTLGAHTHVAGAKNAKGDQNLPGGNTLAIPHVSKASLPAYAPPSGAATLAPTAVAIAGGSLPHNNMPPYLTLTFIIALQGVFPARN